jgi:DNA-3-methyladenine glycosylase I
MIAETERNLSVKKITPSPGSFQTRCPWPGDDELMISYHDLEWGVPLHDDRALFEFLVLDGFQAGLSWRSVLRRRDAFRRAFGGFDPALVAWFSQNDVERLLQDAEIIRNRAKVRAAVTNAQAFLKVRDEFGNFDRFIWKFTGGAPLVNRWEALSQVPARSEESDNMSRELVQRGFKFAGSVICYAFMQAAGMVNDHLVTCPRWAEVQNVPFSQKKT